LVASNAPPEKGWPVRSFRLVFELERRLFKLERWRLPFPYGLPLKGIVYAIGALCALLLLGSVPIAGDALSLLPAPVRFLILPAGIAYVLAQFQLDGRSAHVSAAAWARQRLGPRRLTGTRSAPFPGEVHKFDPITFVPDERSVRYRRASIAGPARMLLRYPVSARQNGSTLVLEQTSERPMWQGKRITLRDDQRLLLR
jgi:hypothetical protein